MFLLGKWHAPFLRRPMNLALPMLKRYASENGCRIDVLLNKPRLRSMPQSAYSVLRCALGNVASYFNSVRIWNGVCPLKFVELFNSADTVISDSFHALMFASIFGKNVRMLKPHDDFRAMMFARITEFVGKFIDGNVVVDNLSEALASLVRTVTYRTNALNDARNESREWLTMAISTTRQ